jgi:hypothetical protein
MKINEIIFFLEKNENTISNAEILINKVMDPLYDYLRDEIGENLILLNNSRILMREGSSYNIEKGIINFNKFKENWKRLDHQINQVSIFLPHNKNILVIKEMLAGVIVRKIQSKIPLPPKKYFEISSNLDESDIDWIIKKIKEYWVKTSQVYASARIALILKSNKL